MRVCFQWRAGDLRNEGAAKLFHLEGTVWQDITVPGSRDTQANVIGGDTSSFSPFIIAEPRLFGFYQPIDNVPTVNVLKAGSSVPVKFSLAGNEGLNIFATGFPRTIAVACDSYATLDAVEETVTAGGSGLPYDAATDTYTYVWKTEKAYGGGCRQFQLQLKDGTVESAKFKFLK